MSSDRPLTESVVHSDGRLCIRKKQIKEVFPTLPTGLRVVGGVEGQLELRAYRKQETKTQFRNAKQSDGTNVYQLSQSGKVLIPGIGQPGDTFEVSFSYSKITIQRTKKMSTKKETLTDPNGISGALYRNKMMKCKPPWPPGCVVRPRYVDTSQKALVQDAIVFQVGRRVDVNGKIRTRFYNEEGKLSHETKTHIKRVTTTEETRKLAWLGYGMAEVPGPCFEGNPSYEEVENGEHIAKNPTKKEPVSESKTAEKQGTNTRPHIPTPDDIKMVFVRRQASRLLTDVSNHLSSFVEGDESHPFLDTVPTNEKTIVSKSVKLLKDMLKTSGWDVFVKDGKLKIKAQEAQPTPPKPKIEQKKPPKTKEEHAGEHLVGIHQPADTSSNVWKSETL
jgi:hypothetical protein